MSRKQNILETGKYNISYLIQLITYPDSKTCMDNGIALLNTD